MNINALFFIVTLSITLNGNVLALNLHKTAEEKNLPYPVLKQFEKMTNSTFNITFAIVKECNNQSCNSKYGSCRGIHTCVCNKYHAHIPNYDTEHGETSACAYSRKSQFTAFLLEFFIPFGASHFYIGKKVFGALKFSILFLLPCFVLLMICNCGRRNTSPVVTKSFINNTLSIIYVVCLLLWMFFDLLNLSLDRYKDKYGIKLAPW